MITQALAVNSAKVYVVGRTGEKLNAITNQYNRDNINSKIILLQADISKKEDITCLYNEIASREK
jgi:short-subunit dehydrogenase